MQVVDGGDDTGERASGWAGAVMRPDERWRDGLLLLLLLLLLGGWSRVRGSGH